MFLFYISFFEGFYCSLVLLRFFFYAFQIMILVSIHIQPVLVSSLCLYPFLTPLSCSRVFLIPQCPVFVFCVPFCSVMLVCLSPGPSLYYFLFYLDRPLSRVRYVQFCFPLSHWLVSAQLCFLRCIHSGLISILVLIPSLCFCSWSCSPSQFCLLEDCRSCPRSCLVSAPALFLY